MADVTWQPTVVALSALVPWDRNPKRISKGHAKRLLDLWQRLGQFQTIAIGPAGEVYDGHQRLSVLKAAHGAQFEVQALQSDRALTEKEREELTVAAHVGTTGQFSWDELSGWDAGELQTWGFDAELLQDWNTGAAALATMLESAQDAPPDDPGAQIDRAEELREKWQTAPGQLWQLGEHRVICGDCTDAAVVERVMGGEPAEACIADPPYGMNWNADASRFSGGKFGNHPRGRERDDVINDDKPFDPSPFLSFPVVALWGMNHYCDKLPPGGLLVWIKKPDNRFGTFLSDCEIAWTNVGHGVYAFRHEWGGITRESERGEFLHPTQKPVVLIEWVMEKTGASGAVYDPFLGSGTTLIACERLGRRCRAVEISPAYVAVTLQRWADMTGQEPVLLEPVTTS